MLHESVKLRAADVRGHWFIYFQCFFSTNDVISLPSGGGRITIGNKQHAAHESTCGGRSWVCERGSSRRTRRSHVDEYLIFLASCRIFRVWKCLASAADLLKLQTWEVGFWITHMPFLCLPLSLWQHWQRLSSGRWLPRISEFKMTVTACKISLFFVCLFPADYVPLFKMT